MLQWKVAWKLVRPNFFQTLDMNGLSLQILPLNIFCQIPSLKMMMMMMNCFCGMVYRWNAASRVWTRVSMENRQGSRNISRNGKVLRKREIFWKRSRFVELLNYGIMRGKQFYDIWFYIIKTYFWLHVCMYFFIYSRLKK